MPNTISNKKVEYSNQYGNDDFIYKHITVEKRIIPMLDSFTMGLILQSAEHSHLSWTSVGNEVFQTLAEGTEHLAPSCIKCVITNRKLFSLMEEKASKKHLIIYFTNFKPSKNTPHH